MEIFVRIALGSKFALGSKYRLKTKKHTRVEEIPPANLISKLKLEVKQHNTQITDHP